MTLLADVQALAGERRAHQRTQPVTTDRFRRVMELFGQACEIPREQRAAFLDQHCGTDPELRAELELMLAHDRQATRILPGAGAHLLAEHVVQADDPPAPAGAVPAPPLAGPALPVLAGQYRIIRVLGEGGMGTVYEAEQAFPRRRVALKAIRRGLASERMLKRFEHEAHVLGRLHHPGIAQIYEAGAADAAHGNQAYFAMELVCGEPLTHYARSRALDVPQKLELVARVCDALQHAHQRGVIHRDLKPSNILIIDDADADARSRDAAPAGAAPLAASLSRFTAQPKILDFGVARAVGMDLNLTTMHTHTGQIVGTLPYMSPEQISADPDDVDTRSDIYAIGVVLFELLAGRLPHDLANRSLPEAARIVCEQSPPLLGSIDRTLRGEIETIVARAIDKSRERRYASAAALAADIRRYLAGEPIDAKRDSAMYLLRKALRRYRFGVATAAVFMLMLAVFGLLAFQQARENLRLATNERDARRSADDAAKRLAAELRTNNIERGRLAGMSGNLALSEELLWREHLRSPYALDTRWALWEYFSRNPCLTTFDAHPQTITDARFSPDGARVLTQAEDGVLQIWNADDMRPLGELRAGKAIIGNRVLCFTPDGRHAATLAPDGGVVIYDLRTHESAYALGGFERRVDTLALGPDGLLLLAFAGMGAELWDYRQPTRLAVLSDSPPRTNALAISTDGRLAALGCVDGRAIIWTAPWERPQVEVRAHDGIVSRVALASDGRTLATGGNDRLIHLWDVTDGRRLATLSAPNGTIRQLQFVDAGKHLFASGWWSLDLWDVQQARRLWSVASPSLCSDISPGATRVLSTVGPELRIWDLAPQRERRVFAGHDGRVCASFSPDGRRVATGDMSGLIRIFDADSGALLQTLAGHTRRVKAVHFAPDGSTLISGAEDGTLRVWNLAGGSQRYALPDHNAQSSQSIALSPDGRTLAVTNRDLSIGLLDLASGRMYRRFPASNRELISACFSRDGTRLITTSRRNAIRHHDLNGALLADVLMAATPWSLAVTADGQYVVTGTWGAALQLHDPETGAERLRLEGHSAVVYGVASHPTDPRLVASASADGTVRLWDIMTRQCLVTLDGFDRWDAITVAFSHDGRRLLAAGANGTAALWDLTYYDRHIAGNLEYQRRRFARDVAP